MAHLAHVPGKEPSVVCHPPLCLHGFLFIFTFLAVFLQCLTLEIFIKQLRTIFMLKFRGSYTQNNLVWFGQDQFLGNQRTLEEVTVPSKETVSYLLQPCLFYTLFSCTNKIK